MKKPDSLRAWLTAYLPEYKTHPDRLAIYVESGSVRARRSATPSFVYAYKLQIGLWEFAGNADAVMLPILLWIQTNQPELMLLADAEPFTFEAELLDGEKSDILISIDLTERVIATPSADGSGFDLSYPEEPQMPPRFPGVDADFIQGWAGHDLAVESAMPGIILTPEIPPEA